MEKTITAVQAENLAISYNAFRDAMKDQDLVAIRVWSRLLKQAQEETGIELASLDILNFNLNRPRK